MAAKVKRKRRSAEEAKAEILQTAKEMVRDKGPDSLRLDEIAAQVGVSRQALLHHFGSREDLLREVVQEAWAGLFSELTELAGSVSLSGPGALEEFIRKVDEVTRKRGNARLGAWLLLSGQGLPEQFFAGALAPLPARLAEVIEPPSSERVDASPSSRAHQTAQFALLLLGAGLFGDAIFGHRIRQALGMPDEEADRQAFLRWLAEIAGGATQLEPATDTSP